MPTINVVPNSQPNTAAPRKSWLKRHPKISFFLVGGFSLPIIGIAIFIGGAAVPVIMPVSLALVALGASSLCVGVIGGLALGAKFVAAKIGPIVAATFKNIFNAIARGVETLWRKATSRDENTSPEQANSTSQKVSTKRPAQDRQQEASNIHENSAQVGELRQDTTAQSSAGNCLPSILVPNIDGVAPASVQSGPVQPDPSPGTPKNVVVSQGK